MILPEGTCCFEHFGFIVPIIMTPWVMSTWISSSMHFNPKISTFISQFHNHAQYLKVNNSGRPLDNQTWHTNGSPQQKLPKSGFRTRLTALWPMEQSSILSAKFDCPVAHIVKLAYSPNLFSWKYLNILLEELIVKENLIPKISPDNFFIITSFLNLIGPKTSVFSTHKKHTHTKSSLKLFHNLFATVSLQKFKSQKAENSRCLRV